MKKFLVQVAPEPSTVEMLRHLILGLSKMNKKKAPRLQDSILHPFLFTLYCYVLEGNEIHISDFFVGMNYLISLLDLYLNASLRVF